MSRNDSLSQAINALHEIVLDVPTLDEETALRQAMASLELARKLIRKANPEPDVQTRVRTLGERSGMRPSHHMHPEEGVDRCACGAKYWDNVTPTTYRCASCGEGWHGRSAV